MHCDLSIADCVGSGWEAGEVSREIKPDDSKIWRINMGTLYCGDCLDVMEQLIAPQSVDLIYADPPFFSNRNYEVIWKDEAEVRSFKDRWEGGIEVYAAWMAERLRACARVLKPTGTIYLHCDWHASHYLKVRMDEIFGQNNFLNEIVWAYDSGGRATKHFHRKHDVILVYSPAGAKQKHQFNPKAISIRRDVCEVCESKLDKWNNLKKNVDDDGRIFRSVVSNGKEYRYYDDEPVSPGDVWHIPHLHQKHPERLGYPTQKPEQLLMRIIAASSSKGDVVLDPFCGSGTSTVVAQKTGREWIGIDISPTANKVVRQRLTNAQKTMVTIGRADNCYAAKSIGR